MSSDKLGRKRRSEFHTSDDSSEEQPPAKARKSELTSRISKILTDTCKNFFRWIAPKFLKDYMIVDNQAGPNMAIADGAKNNCMQDDDDDGEIEVITVQNGTAGVHPQMFRDQKMRIAAISARPHSISTCPLASTPHTFPLNSPFRRTSRTLERRKMNGFPIKFQENKHRVGGENFVAPFTNPSCDIDVLLERKSFKNKEIDIIAEINPQKHLSDSTWKTKSLNSSTKDKANYAEKLIDGASSRSLPSSKSFTALKVVRLQERAQYKLLLDKVVKRSLYRPAVPRKDFQKSPIQIDLTNDDDTPDLSYQFKKDKLDRVNDFVSKYKPCALVPHTAKQEFHNINKEKDSEDDEVQIIDKMPKLKPGVPAAFSESRFSEAWIKELKMTILSETEKHLQLIAETEEKVQRYKKRRDAKIAEESRRIEEMRLAGVILPEDVEMEEDVLPEITPEMEAVIARALAPGNPIEHLSEFDRLILTRNDISTLSNLNWLNDQVINFYLAMIAERSRQNNYPTVYVFNSFFYTSVKTRGPANVMRWTRRIDIFSYDLIIMPLHLEMHWALLVVDNRSKQITYYDSMGSGEDKCLLLIQNYLTIEMQDKKKIILDPNIYSQEIAKDIPKQMNGSDCGMFTLKYAEYISRDAPFSFTQDHMPYFRRRMVYELLTKQIL